MAVPAVDHQLCYLCQKLLGGNCFREEILRFFRCQHIGDSRFPDQLFRKGIDQQLTCQPAADILQNGSVPALPPFVELQTVPVVQTDVQGHVSIAPFLLQSLQKALFCGGERDSGFPDFGCVHGNIPGVFRESSFVWLQSRQSLGHAQLCQHFFYGFIGTGIIFRTKVVNTSRQFQGWQQISDHFLHICDAPTVVNRPG